MCACVWVSPPNFSVGSKEPVTSFPPTNFPCCVAAYNVTMGRVRSSLVRNERDKVNAYDPDYPCFRTLRSALPRTRTLFGRYYNMCSGRYYSSACTSAKKENVSPPQKNHAPYLWMQYFPLSLFHPLILSICLITSDLVHLVVSYGCCFLRYSHFNAVSCTITVVFHVQLSVPSKELSVSQMN